MFTSGHPQKVVITSGHPHKVVFTYGHPHKVGITYGWPHKVVITYGHPSQSSDYLWSPYTVVITSGNITRSPLANDPLVYK